MPVQNLNLSMMTEPVTAGADVRVFPVSALSKKWSKFPRYNMKCIEEIEIPHVILVSLENPLPLGQCVPDKCKHKPDIYRCISFRCDWLGFYAENQITVA